MAKARDAALAAGASLEDAKAAAAAVTVPAALPPPPPDELAELRARVKQLEAAIAKGKRSTKAPAKKRRKR